jgi:DNA-3-methyladenine glycosylase II
LSKADPQLAQLIDDYRGEALRPKKNIFLTLARAIVGQQISVKAADTVWARLEARTNGVRPQAINRLSKLELRNCGLSRSKADYITGIAAASEQLMQLDWAALSDRGCIDRLCELKGVGRWTAEMVLIFALCRADILPLADIALCRAIQNLYADGSELSEVQIRALADEWRPWRSVATWFLWRSLDPVAVEY